MHAKLAYVAIPRKVALYTAAYIHQNNTLPLPVLSDDRSEHNNKDCHRVR